VRSLLASISNPFFHLFNELPLPDGVKTAPQGERRKEIIMLKVRKDATF